jgi:hydroxypyruvate isomerase
MLSFAANLSMLFTEVEFLERFSKANTAGFRGVECQFPYAYAIDALVEQLQRYNLVQVLHNLPSGDWINGDRGIGCLPDRVGEFQDGVGKAIEYATALGCRQVNCLAGVVPPAVPNEILRQTFISNLQFAARELRKAGIKLLIEPINIRDIPGFYLRNTQQAVDIISDVCSDNLYLQYDVYHMQIMEGDIASTIERNLKHIAHVQVADNPGRHEPGTGEINYQFLFRFLDRVGYRGWIGCEYAPATTTEEGLKWLSSANDLA